MPVPLPVPSAAVPGRTAYFLLASGSSYSGAMGLLDFFMRKQRHIQGLIAQYLDQFDNCAATFQEAWKVYVADGIGESFDFKVDQTHKAESHADDLRRKIELELYAKALLPESRGDILGVLESVDRVLSGAEWVLYEMKLEELSIPAPLRPSFSRLVEVSCAACATVSEATRVLFVGSGNADEVLALTDRIDTLESESDHCERGLIRMIFKSGMASGEKVLLKNLVLLLGELSDRAEHTANRIRLVSVKRRV